MGRWVVGSHTFDFEISTVIRLLNFDFHLGSLFWVHVCLVTRDDEGIDAVIIVLFDVVVITKLVSPFCIIEREKKPKKKEYYYDSKSSTFESSGKAAEKATTKDVAGFFGGSTSER